MLNHSNRAVRRTTPGNNICSSLRIFKCYAWVTRSRKEHRVRKVAVASAIHLIDLFMIPAILARALGFMGYFHVTWGAFHAVKISGISGSAVNGTRFVGSSHWKIPRKSGKSKKVGPFSRLEFPNGMSCSIYVSRSLYQFQVHGRAPRRTGVYDQMEQLFTNRKFHFCSHQNSLFFS